MERALESQLGTLLLAPILSLTMCLPIGDLWASVYIIPFLFRCTFSVLRLWVGLIEWKISSCLNVECIHIWIICGNCLRFVSTGRWMRDFTFFFFLMPTNPLRRKDVQLGGGERRKFCSTNSPIPLTCVLFMLCEGWDVWTFLEELLRSPERWHRTSKVSDCGA